MHIVCDSNHKKSGDMREYKLAGEKVFCDGQTLAQVKREARHAGWKFMADGRTYCPACKK